MPTILVVDDQPTILTFYKSMFESFDYDLLTAQNSSEAHEHLKAHKSTIDVILSDINMPDINGYELCRSVKSEPDYKEIPFIFVSGLTDLEEKIKGYEVDADDYITKPILVEEVLSKVKNLISIRESNKAGLENASQSMSVAHQAMVYSSHMGNLLEFVKQGLNTNSYSQLASNIFIFLQGLELTSLLQIHTDAETSTHTFNGSASPLEENIFEMARYKGRFIDFGMRTMINYDDFSLLIKNMPIEDEEKYGMYKDILGTFCDIIEIKTNSLKSKEIQDNKELVLNTITKTLDNVLDSFESIQKNTMTALNEMSIDFDLTFQSLDLLEYQEQNLNEIINSTVEKANQSFDQFHNVSSNFDEHRRKISGMLNSISGDD